MLAFRGRRAALVLLPLLVAASYSSSLKMEVFSRENYKYSCLDSLSSTDIAMLGEDGEVCVDLSTKSGDRRRHPDLPEVLARACASLNEDRDRLQVQFKILDGFAGDFALKRTQGGAYGWLGQIPRAAFQAYRTTTWHTGDTTETTMSLDLTIVHRECCSKGILLTLRAMVYPTSSPGSRLLLYPAEDDSRICRRNYQSRVMTCKVPVSCEEDSCPVRDTGATTCDRTECPDTTSTEGPVDCEIVEEDVGSECSFYGDAGTWQLGTIGNQCVCELNETPVPCNIPTEEDEIFPGDRCFSRSAVNAVAIRTSTNGDCTCSDNPDAVICPGEQVSGTECLGRFGAPGVLVNLGDGPRGRKECVCAVPCEYATNPVSNPSAIAVGHDGQGCIPELAGSDVTPPGVLRQSELELGTCSCQPLRSALFDECDIPNETDSSGEPLGIPAVPYSACILLGNIRGVSIPTDADPDVCDCVPKEACQCVPGETCEYTGMFPGDSCETEFGTGLVAQRSDSIGCNCRINCTLSPCDGDPEDCEDYTFGTCDLEDGERGIVVPTSVPGTCTCERCDPGKCAHPDAGCIVEGKSCSNLNGLMDVFFTDDTTKCNCGCDLSIPDQAGRSASLGGVCLQGLARGVVVTGNEEGECGCQVQNCTSSSCEGPDCETFDGVLGESCDSDTGIVEILQDGSCKCQPICQTVNCGDGPEICTDPDGTPKVGDVCVLEFGSLGVLEASSDVAGECDCVAPTCVYTYQIRIGRNSIGTGFGNPGDACTTSEAPGVVSDECECEPLCDVECIPVGCQTNTGRCTEEIPPVIVNGQCLTSSEVAGTYQLVSGSGQFCECVASR